MTVAENNSVYTLDLTMTLIRRQDSFDDSDYVSCPVGGEWWKCEDQNYPTFIGCCSSNPCSGQMCLEENLYPMGFGTVAIPTPDYPNHSCPYGGLWYTCADNAVPFQGCCESNPCNGQGCPASDLRAAAVHTVVVGETSTFTVPPTVATGNPSATVTSSPASTTSNLDGQFSKSTPSQSMSKPDTAAIAGGAAVAAALLTCLVGLAAFFLIRRRRIKNLKQESLRAGRTPPEFKPFYKDPLGAGKSSLSGCSRSISLITLSSLDSTASIQPPLWVLCFLAKSLLASSNLPLGAPPPSSPQRTSRSDGRRPFGRRIPPPHKVQVTRQLQQRRPC
jgi:hypothetical protein